MHQTRRILVAPLNWGLGHASRCIPIIRALQQQGADVVLASDGQALELLKNEFPELPAAKLPAYGISYRTENMFRNIAGQLPKIAMAILREHFFIKKIIRDYRLEGIISDNRFGCFSEKIPCVFLTHQLNIHIEQAVLSRLVNFFNRLFISRFDACWVPDVPGEPNLSGDLSHGVFWKKISYVGALSRMHFFETEKRYDAVVVLSGPEPQRSYLEQAITAQARQLPLRFLIVQGKAGQATRFIREGNLEIAPFLGSEALNEAALAGAFYIGRSGYSTIMDLARLGLPALLIPTPGQTEQEYLAKKFFEQGIFLMQEQSALDLKKAIAELPDFRGLDKHFSDEKLLIDEIRLRFG